MPIRDLIPFVAFRDNYANLPHLGFRAVNYRLDEDEWGKTLPVVLIDLICEWRLDDGKIRFIEVPFADKAEFNVILTYLKVNARFFHEALKRQAEELEATQ